MPSKRHRHVYWPEFFTKRRDFNRQAENQPYLDFVQTPKFSGEEDEDNDDDSCSEEDCDISIAQRKDVEGRAREDESVELAKISDGGEDDAKVRNRLGNARCFMTGMIGDDETLQYPDQVDQVATFCEQLNFEEFDAKLSKDMRCVALLDDSNIDGTAHDKQGSFQYTGQCRPHLGPLTRQALYEELRKKRFGPEPSQDIADNGFGVVDSDAERRLIFITGLDPLTIEILVRTASRSQAPALRDLLYKQLTRKASIGVTIPAQGFLTFTLDLQIPYYVLRETSTLLEDTRMKPDGKPLRESRLLPSFSQYPNAPNSANKVYCLYEAQTSVAVTGIDHWVYVAYCFVDTYFESKNMVEWYDGMTGTKGRTDPFAAGRINAGEPIRTPREYFFKVFEIRALQVLREWNGIFLWVENQVKRSRKHHVFPLASNDARTRQEVREFCDWNCQMVNVLGDLIGALSETVGAWNKFRRNDINYFSHDDKPPTSSSLNQSAFAVERTFSDLEDLLQKLRVLEITLRKGLSSHLNIENNEAAFFQQRTARHIQVLTVLTIIFYPLTLNANLFSAPGVLPLAPNLAHFAYVLVILAVLVGVTLAVLYKWQSWSDSLWTMIDCVRKSIIDYRERKVKEEMLHPKASISPAAGKWTFPGWRSKEPDPHELGEIEKRVETLKPG